MYDLNTTSGRLAYIRQAVKDHPRNTCCNRCGVMLYRVENQYKVTLPDGSMSNWMGADEAASYIAEVNGLAVKAKVRKLTRDDIAVG